MTKSLIKVNGGVNDKKYPARQNGKFTKTYSCWSHMFTRCYDEKFHESRPNYAECSVGEDFKLFSSFSDWCVEQKGFFLEGTQLDKDLLYPKNKVYSGETCCFIPRNVNNFLAFSTPKNDLPVGVYYNKYANKYHVQVNNGEGKSLHIGYYTSVDDAVSEYTTSKNNIAKKLAEKYRNILDEKTIDALLNFDVGQYI